MNKPLKFSSFGGPILFCSDPHLQHRPDWGDTPPLWKSRGFESGDQHDEWFEVQWRAIVTPETVVFSLGDHTFTDPKGEAFKRFSELPGRIYALAGNHPSGLKTLYREALRARGLEEHEMLYPVKIGNVSLMGESIHAFIDGVSVYMQHYPCFVWPELKAGGFHLHGHCHGRLPESNVDAVASGKVLDIGVDNAIASNGTPFFSWAQVQQIMSKKPVIKRDHH